jgi:ribonuclease MRP protein subunit SNM1
MASPSVSVRLQYLNDSAHLLATTAPSTSAYLMSRCNSLMLDNEVEQTDSYRRQICGACGNIMILGWTGTRHLESLRIGQRKRDRIPTAQGSKAEVTKAIVYKCELCDRRTRINMNTTIARSTKASVSQSLPKKLLNSTLIKTPSPTSANASSRKRARARKHGGLQALLAKNKDSGAVGRPCSGFGLDLLDLMKKA